MSGVGHGAGYHGLTGGLIMMQTLTIMINSLFVFLSPKLLKLCEIDGVKVLA